MTDDVEKLREILRPARHVLLDFDGPVCSVFAGFPAREVARQLGSHLAKLVDGPADWAEEADPFKVLRRVEQERPYLLAEADDALGALEREAVASATPTPGVTDFLQACLNTGRTVSAVSNNTGHAISSYLAAHGLGDYFAAVFGREPGRPSSMKPSPHLLITAVAAAGVRVDQCVLVGDAVRDIEAAHSAGMPAIGYANKPGKDAALTGAGAVMAVDSMELMANAVTSLAVSTE